MSELTKEKYADLLAEVKSGRFVHFGGRSAGNIEQLEFIARAEGLELKSTEKAVTAAVGEEGGGTTKDSSSPAPADSEAEKKQKVSLAKRAVTNAEKAVTAAVGEEALKAANERLEEAKKALEELKD